MKSLIPQVAENCKRFVYLQDNTLKSKSQPESILYQEAQHIPPGLQCRLQNYLHSHVEILVHATHAKQLALKWLCVQKHLKQLLPSAVNTVLDCKLLAAFFFV